MIKYFHDHAAEYGFDTSKFIVLGFSAGANIATIMAILAREKLEFNISGQILHYPFLDAKSSPKSKKSHVADLPVEVMEAFTKIYASGEDLSEYTLSPLYAKAKQLKNTAQAALFLAEEDALCEEGCVYGAKLTAAGVVTKLRIFEHAHHGYLEDLFNLPCYNDLPKDIKERHHKEIASIAEQSFLETIEYIKKICHI